MGKIVKPKYRVEMTGVTPAAWRVKGYGQVPGYGKPTDANLEKFVHGYAKSLEIGGVNEHVSKALGHVPYPTSARIVDQDTGAVVASWKAGMFQVW